MAKQFSNEITDTPPEDCDQSFTNGTRVKQGNVKMSGKQVEYRLTFLEYAPKPRGYSLLCLIGVGVDYLSEESFDFFLDISSLGEFPPTNAPTFNETSLGDESQLQPNISRWLIAPDGHAELEDRGTHDSTSNQHPLSTGIHLRSTFDSYVWLVNRIPGHQGCKVC